MVERGAGTTFRTFAWPALATIFLAILLPTACYFILRTVFRFDIANAAGVAALYGSVSSVTFAAGIGVVETASIGYEGFIPTLAALAEWGIIVALFWGRLGLKRPNDAIGKVVQETLTGRSVILLMGGLLIGMIIGEQGFARIAVVFSQGPEGLFRGQPRGRREDPGPSPGALFHRLLRDRLRPRCARGTGGAVRVNDGATGVPHAPACAETARRSLGQLRSPVILESGVRRALPLRGQWRGAAA